RETCAVRDEPLNGESPREVYRLLRQGIRGPGGDGREALVGRGDRSGLQLPRGSSTADDDGIARALEIDLERARISLRPDREGVHLPLGPPIRDQSGGRRGGGETGLEAFEGSPSLGLERRLAGRRGFVPEPAAREGPGCQALPREEEGGVEEMASQIAQRAVGG